MAKHGMIFVVNNYTTAQELTLQGLVGTCGVSYVLFAREVGEQGTPHLQGYIQANHRIYSRLQAHVRCAYKAQLGDSAEAIAYIKGPYEKNGKSKPAQEHYEAGVAVHIPAPPRKGQGHRTDLDAVKRAIDSGESYDDICEAQFETVAKYPRFIKERVQARDSAAQHEKLAKNYENVSLRPWQQRLMDILEEEVSPRKIYWQWSPNGDMGKSWMATFLAVQHGALVLSPGKKADLAFTYAQKPTKIVCFDLSKTTAPEEGCKTSPWDVMYSLAEDLKNGRVFSPKYESMVKYFDVPHVVFFANSEPDYNKWSVDRYQVSRVE